MAMMSDIMLIPLSLRSRMSIIRRCISNASRDRRVVPAPDTRPGVSHPEKRSAIVGMSDSGRRSGEARAVPRKGSGNPFTLLYRTRGRQW